jgi:hypothetical protein
MKPGGSGREKHTFVDRSKATEPAAGSIETGKNGRLRLIGCLATIFVSTSRR